MEHEISTPSIILGDTGTIKSSRWGALSGRCSGRADPRSDYTKLQLRFSLDQHLNSLLVAKHIL